jgi:hypothetical protein
MSNLQKNSSNSLYYVMITKVVGTFNVFKVSRMEKKWIEIYSKFQFNLGLTYLQNKKQKKLLKEFQMFS